MGTLMSDEIIQYLVFRADLRLPKGKVAAQAGHGVQLSIRRVEAAGDEQSREWLREWEAGSYVKVALKVDDVQALEELCRCLEADGVLYATVIDEGRTCIEAGTMTLIALQPLPRARASPVVARLSLF